MKRFVRVAGVRDRSELVEMMEAFYTEVGTPFDPERADRAFDEILRDGSIGRVWMLEGDGAPAGYVVLTFGFSLEFGGRDAFVDDLYVRPEHRGQGLARAAMEAVLDECRRGGVRALHLEVARANEAAKTLYRRFGFADRSYHLMTQMIEEDDTGA